jgi:hypothetical protein
VLLPVLAACVCCAVLLWAAPVVCGSRRWSRHAPRHRAVAQPPRHASSRTKQLGRPFGEMRVQSAGHRNPRVGGQSDVAGLGHQRGVVHGQRAVRFGRREEDRIRPMVDRTGARIWVAEEDLFWHDIVLWPCDATQGVRRFQPARTPTPAADPPTPRVAGDHA